MDTKQLPQPYKGWVPIPYTALHLAHRPEEVSVVVSLYQEAHARHWAPFQVAERRLAHAALLDRGAGREVVRDMLRALQGRGLLRREPVQTGKRSGGWLLTVQAPPPWSVHSHGHLSRE